MRVITECMVCDGKIKIDPTSPMMRVTCGGLCSRRYIRIAERIRERYIGKYKEVYKDDKKK